MRRTCRKIDNCDKEYNKPSETRSCIYEKPEKITKKITTIQKIIKKKVRNNIAGAAFGLVEEFSEDKKILAGMSAFTFVLLLLALVMIDTFSKGKPPKKGKRNKKEIKKKTKNYLQQPAKIVNNIKEKVKKYFKQREKIKQLAIKELENKTKKIKEQIKKKKQSNLKSKIKKLTKSLKNFKIKPRKIHLIKKTKKLFNKLKLKIEKYSEKRKNIKKQAELEIKQREKQIQKQIKEKEKHNQIIKNKLNPIKIVKTIIKNIKLKIKNYLEQREKTKQLAIEELEQREKQIQRQIKEKEQKKKAIKKVLKPTEIIKTIKTKYKKAKTSISKKRKKQRELALKELEQREKQIQKQIEEKRKPTQLAIEELEEINIRIKQQIKEKQRKNQIRREKVRNVFHLKSLNASTAHNFRETFKEQKTTNHKEVLNKLPKVVSEEKEILSNLPKAYPSETTKEIMQKLPISGTTKEYLSNEKTIQGVKELFNKKEHVMLLNQLPAIYKENNIEKKKIKSILDQLPIPPKSF